MEGAAVIFILITLVASVLELIFRKDKIWKDKDIGGD